MVTRDHGRTPKYINYVGREMALVAQVLAPGGKLYVADYGEQRSRLMRLLFRLTIQQLDGVHHDHVPIRQHNRIPRKGQNRLIGDAQDFFPGLGIKLHNLARCRHTYQK